MKTCKILSLLFFITVFQFAKAQEPNKKISIFRDSTDNAVDISDWLINKKGVLIVPSLITEPTVGYGIGGAVVYFHSSYSEKKGPPSMSGILGAGTQNGTWAAGIVHIGYWKHDRLRYTGVVLRTNANLDFYGSGKILFQDEQSVNLNLDAWVVLQQLKGRLGKSNFFIGGKYILLSTYNVFDIPIDIPEFTGNEFASTLSEASLILNYDSRNNVFTPTKGFYLELNSTYSDTWMGSDALYGRIGFDALAYLPAGDKIMVSLRAESKYSLGDLPFYARPIIQLRGAPLMKYQDKNTSLMEAEISWNVYKRWSLIGFTGLGNAYSSISEIENGKSVRTIGSGFRYKLARKFGANMGIDFAFSQDDFAFYIVFGTAWLR
ncbi:MAG: BamA/TamA family outer membrane protein [Bacteroidales bacterium]